MGGNIDPLIVFLIERYLQSEQRLGKDSHISTDETKVGNTGEKFVLTRWTGPNQGPPLQGKYGVVDYYLLYDQRGGETKSLVAKRNKGTSRTDAIKVTEIEDFILKRMQERYKGSDDPPTVRSYGACEDIILEEFLQGNTLEEYVNYEGGLLPYEQILSLVDSMLEINLALCQILSRRVDYRQFLSMRKFQVLQNEILKNDETFILSETDAIDNFYTYRVAQAGMLTRDEADGLMDIYKGIERILFHAKPTWISFDHPQNRIVLDYGSGLNTGRYDFNHIAQEHIGLELAMLLGAIRGSKAGPQAICSYTNIAHMVALDMYVKRLKGRKTASALVEQAKDTISKIREDGATSLVDVRPFFEINELLTEFVTMYAAFLHRNTLDAFRAASKYAKTGNNAYEAMSERKIDANMVIAQQAKAFEKSIGEKRRDYLHQNGYFLMTDATQLNEFVKIGVKRVKEAKPSQ